MLIVQLCIVYCAIVFVNLVAANYAPWCVHHPYLSLGSNYHIILYEVYPGNLLTVHVEIKQLLLFLNAQTDDIPINISKSNDIFLLIDCNRSELIFVIIEMLLIVKNTSNIPKHFDGAVPRCWDDGFSFRHVGNINDGVVMSRKRFGFAAIHNVEDVDVVVPCANLS